jgi:hypothetical protein
MKITMIAALSIATAATALPLAATAQANVTHSYIFQSPSGNIGCEIFDRDDGTGDAVCKIHDRTWVSPAPGGDWACAFAGQDLILYRGAAACVGAYPSQIWLALDYNKVTLAYGQTHTVGTITCDSEPTGVTCTDTATGHFFRVSRENYELG